MAAKPEHENTVAVNRQASHEYFIIEKHEAGIELCGTEVKSIRQGKMNLKDSYCAVEGGELKVYGMHVSPYDKGNIFNRDPMRVRRLLMHKREISRLFGLVKQQGYTLIPLCAYFLNGRLKIEVGVCKGKKLYDKREDAAKRSAQRDIDRSFRGGKDD